MHLKLLLQLHSIKVGDPLYSCQGRFMLENCITLQLKTRLWPVRKWRHFLAGRHFKLKTDQRTVVYMFDNRKRTKIRNNKIQGWRLELASFCYTIEHRPGKENVAPDSLTRALSSSMSISSLSEIHEALSHPLGSL